MNSNYEQLNVESIESFQSPFYNKKSRIHFSEIKRSKNTLVKLLLIVIALITISILFVNKYIKEKALDKINIENAGLNEQILVLKAKESELNEMLKKNNTEKQMLSKQNDDFTYSIQQFTDKNEELERQIVESKGVVDELQIKLEKVEKQLKDAIEENEDVEREKKKMEEDEYSEDIRKLQKKIKELQDEMENILKKDKI